MVHTAVAVGNVKKMCFGHIMARIHIWNSNASTDVA